MRVKMSDATLTEDRRIFERAVGHLGAAAETIALREARAILAETEPEGRAVGISHRSTAYVSLPVLTWERRTSALCGVGSVAAALAESLRSFVEA